MKRTKIELRCIKIAKKYKNQLVLNMDKVVRITGLGRDDMDIYWIQKDMHGRITWDSCVGGFVPLKGRIPKEDYKRLEEWFRLNTGNPFPRSTTAYLEKMMDKNEILVA